MSEYYAKYDSVLCFSKGLCFLECSHASPFCHLEQPVAEDEYEADVE